MTTEISGFGFRARLVASATYPQGISITEFADDADPFDVPQIDLGDSAMGLNGDLITWSKPTPLNVTINVIPGSEDDKNLSVLAETNRVGKGKVGARDTITLTGIYANGSTITFSQGRLVKATPGKSIASAGRLKTKAYMFAFENLTTAG